MHSRFKIWQQKLVIMTPIILTMHNTLFVIATLYYFPGNSGVLMAKFRGRWYLRCLMVLSLIQMLHKTCDKLVATSGGLIKILGSDHLLWDFTETGASNTLCVTWQTDSRETRVFLQKKKTYRCIYFYSDPVVVTGIRSISQPKAKGKSTPADRWQGVDYQKKKHRETLFLCVYQISHRLAIWRHTAPKK